MQVGNVFSSVRTVIGHQLRALSPQHVHWFSFCHYHVVYVQKIANKVYSLSSSIKFAAESENVIIGHSLHMCNFVVKN